MCTNNNKCKKDKCNTCLPKARYCGDDLLCIGVNKGDTYDSALIKINDILCECCSGSNYEYINTTTWRASDVTTDIEDYTLIEDIVSPSDTYPEYTATESGKYKITWYSVFTPEDSSSQFYVGVSKNNIPVTFVPNTEWNSETTCKHIIYHQTNVNSTFVIDLNSTDILKFYIRVENGMINLDGEHKFIIEKIG